VSSLMWVLSVVLVVFEFQNVLSWWRGRTIRPGEGRSNDFTIVVPLFGHPRYFDRRSELRPYQNNVLVALEVSSSLMAAFANQLEEEGWRVERLRISNPNPAILLKAALPAVTTTYVLRLDADTSVGDDIPRAVTAAAAARADICSIKCAVANRVNAVTRIQALEYRMAMLARHFRPWLTSGACFLARTEALRTILDRHSLWTPGEDIETGRVALALRMRIRHLDLVVETEAPETWLALARQRRLWWAGTFRHFWINVDRNLLHLPVLTLYSLAVIWVSLYFKLWTMIDFHGLPRAFPLIFAAYIMVTVISNLQVLSPWMIVFPLYSMLQVLVMPVVGAVYYVVLARRRGCLGRYGFDYRRRRLPATAPSRPDAIAGLRVSSADAGRACAGAFASLFDSYRALSRTGVSPSSRLFEALASESG
jgi:cellulose synthase/poly-beta-1,6-N-acetylglucosamine synthase-like glycosyltransferase